MKDLTPVLLVVVIITLSILQIYYVHWAIASAFPNPKGQVRRKHEFRSNKKRGDAEERIGYSLPASCFSADDDHRTPPVWGAVCSDSLWVRVLLVKMWFAVQQEELMIHCSNELRENLHERSNHDFRIFKPFNARGKLLWLTLSQWSPGAERESVATSS